MLRSLLPEPNSLTALLSVMAVLALSACSGGSSAPGSDAVSVVNRAPLALADTKQQTGAMLAIAVLENDSDPDGDSLRIVAVGSAAHGSVAIDDNNTAGNTADDRIMYTPQAGFAADDAFNYIIEDARGARATAGVTLMPSPDRPVANADSVETEPDTPVVINVLTNDSDPSGALLAIASLTAAANGTVSIDDNGTPADGSDDFVVYTPAGGFSGSDGFSYTITNGMLTAGAAVTVTVNSPDDAVVRGHAMKGSIGGATVTLFAANDAGLPAGSALASAVTDDDGAWSTTVPLPRVPLLVVSSGGSYVDETDTNPNIALRRRVSLASGEGLEGLLIPSDEYLALTMISNAVLERARNRAAGSEILHHYANAREAARLGLGLDPVSTQPANPASPSADAATDSRRYALLLGGLANALNEVAQHVGSNAVSFAMIDAMVRDLVDCGLDGTSTGGAVNFQLANGSMAAMPTNLNWNLQVLRFRNNLAGQYGSLLTEVDEPLCATEVSVPDTAAPVITRLGPNPLIVEAATAMSDPGVAAADDRDGDISASVVVTGVVDTTSVGGYALVYTATDSAGNSAATTRDVLVVDTRAPVITLTGAATIVVSQFAGYADAGASAWDALDGDVSAGISSNAGVVNTSVQGEYVINYSVTDAAGNVANAVLRTVIVVPASDPVISLIGTSPVIVEAGMAYSDAGATATDAEDGDITGSIVVTNAVNTSVPGMYTVTYEVTDSDGNVAVPLLRSVQVVDTTAPVISLSGSNPQLVEAATAYVEQGATAVDSMGGDLTASVVVNASAVDITTPGSYVVTYNVADAAGNDAVPVTRTVQVTDTTAPVISLSGSNPQIVEAATAYVELGATASDTLDGNLTVSVVVDTSAVDITTPGSYLVTYNVADAAGNAAVQVTRTVQVTDTTAPVITLSGSNPQLVEAASAYVEQGAAALDSVDGNLTASVTANASAVDAATPGSYTVTYNVADAAGNAAAQVTRTVQVVDTTAPVITPTGANPFSITQNASYTDPGASASDAVDGDLSGAVTVDDSAVDTTTIGSYAVSFSVTDAAGNNATASRTVDVIAPSADLDSDGDGLTDADEVQLAATLHPCLSEFDPDFDNDGLSDGVEVDSGSDPCVVQGGVSVSYVDASGPSADWPAATAALPTPPGNGASATEPHIILVAQGTYSTQIDLAFGCDHVTYLGSLDPADPGQAAVLDPDGSPTTVIDMGGARNSEVAGCTNIRFHNIRFTNGVGATGGGGTRGGGMRASGGSTVVLDGVWMTNGFVSDQGGGLGVSNAGTVATVRNSVMRDNWVVGGKGGGGIWVGNGATLDLADSRLLNNVTASVGGGGLYADPGATVTVNRSVISGNAVIAPASDGGGLWASGSASMSVYDSIVSGNYARDHGAGAYLVSTGPQVKLYNVLFSGNRANGAGGAVYMSAVSGTEVRNVTAVYNQTGDSNSAGMRLNGTPNVQDSVFWRNRTNDDYVSDVPGTNTTFDGGASAFSSFNVMESPDANLGNNDIDIVGGTPGFTAGYYLQQISNPSVSPSFDSGSAPAPGASPLQLDQKYTDSAGSTDAGMLDRGYHYLQPSVGIPDGVSVVLPEAPSGLAAGSAAPQYVVIEPLVAAATLGDGQQVTVTVSSAPAGLVLQPVADIEPTGPGSLLATDLGAGHYQFAVNTSAAGPGTLELTIEVNGVNLSTISIAVN